MILGSSLIFSAQGGRGKEKYLVAAENPVRPHKNTAEGGCGGNSAVFLQKTEASPAALLVKARHHRKILFSLGERKIGRAQNEKSKEYFSVGYASGASGGGAASLVPFKVGSRKVYNYSTKTEQSGFFKARRCGGAARAAPLPPPPLLPTHTNFFLPLSTVL